MNKEIYYKIIDDLIEYSDLYYNKGISKISDKEFDDLLKMAEAIEVAHPDWVRKDSPVNNVGKAPSTSERIKHNRKMLSLGNTYSKEELKEWFDKMRKEHGVLDFIIEPKYDGVSFSAVYANGKLVRGLTRGDGEYGEDITQNLKEISDLNKVTNDFSGEVRGEIIMSKKEFERINSEGQYANPRNLASGTLKLLDVEKFKERKLNAFVYWLEESSHITHKESLDTLMFHHSFRTGKYYVATTFNEMWKAVKEIEKSKKDFPYEIDGAVIKVNHIGLWSEIGETSKFPHWAKAYKYEPDTTITKVKDVEFWVGRTGKITPVAILEPVFLAGTTVQKATLNNKAYMENLDIQIGDSVNIKKAAEIIPFINHVVKDLRENETRTLVEFPTHCPECGTKLEKLNEDHQDYYCVNETCPSKIIGQIVHYTTAMEIDGFAEIIVEKIHNAGLLDSIEDLYLLKNYKKELLELERFGEKLVDNLIQNIENSKTQRLEKFLSGIGIRNVGLSTSKQLVKKFKTLSNIQNATYEELIEVPDIADVVANNIVTYFEDNKKMINRIKEFLNLEEGQEQEVEDMLEGKSFCITGSLSRVRREYEELIEQKGGKNVSGVTSKTDYLVTNDQVTETSKLKKARELGTTIITEDELAEMLGL